MHIFSRNMLFAFLLLVLTILSGTYTFAQSEPCDILIDFEDLTVGSTFKLGEVFYPQNIEFSVVQFYRSDGTPANTDTLGVTNIPIFTGKNISTYGTSLKLTLPIGTKEIRIDVADQGGNLNLKINNKFLNFHNPTDIHNTSLGGVNISFSRITTSNPYEIVGILSFQGDIKTFEIGGVELIIDNVCIIHEGSIPDDCNYLSQFEDLPLNSQYAAGTTLTSNSIAYAVSATIISGVSGSIGDVKVTNRSFTGNVNQNIFLQNISIKPQLPGNVRRISFNAANAFKYLKIAINGVILIAKRTSEIHNKNVGGVLITLLGSNQWFFTGSITDFEVGGLGGDGLYIDNFCIETGGPIDCPFDPDFEYTNCSGLVVDDFIDRSASAGESNGFRYQFYIDGQQVYPNGIDPSFNDLLHVFSTYGEHEGRLEITDPQGSCTEAVTKSIFVYPEIPDPNFTIVGAGCSGNNVHFEYIIPPNPALPPNTEYEYFWNWRNLTNPRQNHGESTGIKRADDHSPISYDFNPPSPGQYQMKLTIQYRGGYCTNFFSTTFQASTLTVTPTIDYHYCSDSITGDITLHVTGGSPPYQYSLNGAPPQTSNSYQGLAPGNYTITITDGSGCEVDHGVEIMRDENRIPKTTELCASPGPCAGASSAAGVNVKFTAQNGNPGSSGTYHYNIVRENSGDIVYSGTGTWNALQSVTVSGLYSDEQIRVIITEDLTHTIDLVQCPLQSPVIAVPRLTMDFAVTTTTPIEVCDDTETVGVTLSVTPQVVGSPSFCGSYPADRPINLELQKKQQDGSYQTVSAQTGVFPGQAHTFTFSGSGEYRVSATYDASGFNCTSYFDFLVKKKICPEP